MVQSYRRRTEPQVVSNAPIYNRPLCALSCIDICTAAAQTVKEVAATMPAVIDSPPPNMPLSEANNEAPVFPFAEKPINSAPIPLQAVSATTGSEHAALSSNARYGPHTKTADPRLPRPSAFVPTPEDVSCDRLCCFYLLLTRDLE